MLPEFLRQQAVCIMALDCTREDEAKGLLLRALELARKQHALLLEMRVAAELALLPSEPAAASAQRLQDVYDRCHEGFDTPDVMRVAGLLRALAGADADHSLRERAA
jgi:hypothetical protein